MTKNGNKFSYDPQQFIDARNQLMLTQSKLAVKALVSYDIIYKIERGQPVSLKSLRVVSEALGIKPVVTWSTSEGK
jgi:DNA-binding XRE family transcriptional regulator